MMSGKSSAAKIQADLRRLYNSNTEYRAFFDWIAERKNDSNETTVDMLKRLFKMDRQSAVGFLQDLAKAGLGEYVVGRRGAKTRIKWDYELNDIGAMAQGGNTDLAEIVNVPVDDEEAPEMVKHIFNLRPDVRVSIALPEDLTRREAERLGAFVQTLPLGE